METLPKFGISRADMMKRVARFKELKGSDGGAARQQVAAL